MSEVSLCPTCTPTPGGCAHIASLVMVRVMRECAYTRLVGSYSVSVWYTIGV